MTKTFTFPVVIGKDIVVEYNQEVEDFIDQVINRKIDIENRGEKVTHLIVGRYQMKLIMAYVSYINKKPIFPKDFDGIPIIVLDQEHYMDWVYNPIRMLMKDNIKEFQYYIDKKEV